MPKRFSVNGACLEKNCANNQNQKHAVLKNKVKEIRGSAVIHVLGVEIIKPIYKEIDGVKCEPIERLTVDIPEEFTGTIMDSIIARRGEMVNMMPTAGGYTRLEFLIPSRGLIGYRSEMLTATRGMGILNSILESYEPYKGDITPRTRGTLIAWENGTSITYGLFNAQERGTLFIGAGVEVYEGMIVGECSRLEDITVNVCKRKHATNTRASGSDDALKLVPPKELSLEQCLDFIADDELLEVTPNHLRMRKRILKTDLRAKAKARA